MPEKQKLIESLTGIRSSKKSYYTELKKTVSQLQKKNTELEIINDMMKNFNVDMSLEDMLNNMLNKLKRIFRFIQLKLALLEDGHLFLKHVYPLGSYAKEVGSEISKQKSSYWQVINEGKVIFETYKDPGQTSFKEDGVFNHPQIKSRCILPLISKGNTIGVISLGSNETITYQQTDLAFFQQLANQLSVCIENYRLYNVVLQGEKEWKNTFNSVQDLLVVVDTNGRIERFNTPVERYLKLSGNQILGKSIQCFFTLVNSDNVDIIQENLVTKKPVFEQIALQGDRILEVSIFPVYDNKTDNVQGTILNIKDVTERTHMESQLSQSAKLAAIGEMAAGVAHELNSPLTAILGNSQLLMRRLDEKDPSYTMLDDIHNCGKRSKKIISNLLTFSRQDEPHFEKCSINLAVEQVISLIGYQIERQNIELDIQLYSALPKMEGNLQQIEQIVINLLMNAKDELGECTHPHKKITVKTGIKTVDGSDWVILTVADNGRGIPVEKQTDIFYPFYTTKESMKGTGLGLSVSLGITKNHGGKLEISSETNEGTCFILMIPALNHKGEGVIMDG